jgi:indolepyruvate ferredoxin oxidoreductase
MALADPAPHRPDEAARAGHDGARAFLSGNEALVRLLLAQAERDRAAGLKTAGYVTGYRGSPLGGLDKALGRAAADLSAHEIKFQPGLNEELAATALWGTQQVGLFDGAKQAGVFGLWYGKGPGVDRAGDAFKHANLAGTAPLGGVLAVAGDDHAAASSTTAHQSEFAFADAMIPVLAPATVQEILDLGLMGFALSRYAGCWAALKLAADIAEGAASVRTDGFQPPRLPEDFAPPADGLHIRWPDRADRQEARLIGPKMQAVHDFARANELDRMTVNPAAKRGIVAAGKAWSDLRQTLIDLGIDEARCAALGLRLYKVALVWPLEPAGVREFAAGLDEILVIEEKRPLIESQLRDALYDLPDGARPRIIGKRDGDGRPLLPSAGELTPHGIARVLTKWLGLEWTREESNVPSPTRDKPPLRRQPHFCSGCPHSRATRTPEGSRALAGIGCHTMALWTDANTKTLTQMGGEGATWIGQAPFTDTPHVFQNIGDGTFAHSGLLAIRAAVAAGVNITYRLLYNDAVAMTGGQAVEGTLTVPRIARILEAEGVARIIVAAEEPDRYPAADPFPPGVTVTGRDAFDCAQRELREVPGVTVLIFDQTCAAEKRRRRGRGEMAPPKTYAFINEAVCEDCGDCITASNCLSVVPVETDFGRKRRIDQASCNADLSCTDGFCPSFVTVEGARLRQAPAPARALPAPLPPEPELPALARPMSLLIAGIGGTGVVTLGRILGRAAESEGKAVSVADQTGLAQKGGAVLSHLRIAVAPVQIGAARIGPARDGIDGADVILGCDLVVTAGDDVLARAKPAARAVINEAQAITGSFLRDPDKRFPAEDMRDAILRRLGVRAAFVGAGALAAAHTGRGGTANILLLGYAWQKGLIPIGGAAIRRAIEQTFAGRGEATVASNLAAFDAGRRAAADGDAATVRGAPPPASLDDLIAHRAAALTDYQNATLASRYRALVARVRETEAARAPGRQDLTEAVARGYYRLLAAKDEYEVARLFTTPAFRDSLARQFDGDYRVHFHLAPAILNGAKSGSRPRKRRFGPWLMPVLRLLAACRGLRGSALDPFARTAERKLERTLREEYEQSIAIILDGLSAETYVLAVDIARLPESIRGFGPVKQGAAEAARRRREELLVRMSQSRKVHAATIAAE